MNTKGRKWEQGFTLIEIIAVLVILGILAAVAVPKFLNMQDEAKKKSAEQAVAAAQSQIAMYYSTFLLKSGGDTDAAWRNATANATGTDNCGVETDDYVIECTGSDEITITAWTSSDGTKKDDEDLNATGTFKNPASE